VEWRFRSNQPFDFRSSGCDAAFVVAYLATFDLIYMFGDAVISFSGDFVRSGLAIGEFHTYRFESPDGAHFCFYADGRVFYCLPDNQYNGYSYVQMQVHGGCSNDLLPTINEWDYVRFGRIAYGEKIVSSDPPQGFVDARTRAPLDRFTVTYDAPNYVYIDEIAVAVAPAPPLSSPLGKGGLEGGPIAVPAVIATRRLDNGPPDVVEIVLDRPMPYNATTRFTLNDGVAVNIVEYTFAPGDTDGDGDADLYDFAALQNCFGVSPISGACQVFDFNADSAIDFLDFAGLQRVFTTP
jgi:hypothetical protein